MIGRMPVYLTRRTDKGPPVPDTRIVTLEFEVHKPGKEVETERIKVLDIEVPVWLNWFKEEHGNNGQAYYIREPKLNETDYE